MIQTCVVKKLGILFIVFWLSRGDSGSWFKTIRLVLCLQIHTIVSGVLPDEETLEADEQLSGENWLMQGRWLGANVHVLGSFPEWNGPQVCRCATQIVSNLNKPTLVSKNNHYKIKSIKDRTEPYERGCRGNQLRSSYNNHWHVTIPRYEREGLFFVPPSHAFDGWFWHPYWCHNVSHVISKEHGLRGQQLVPAALAEGDLQSVRNVRVPVSQLLFCGAHACV